MTAKLDLDKRPLEHRLRATTWRLLGLMLVAYTLLAAWAISPLNKFDEPQIYQFKLMDKWDESYEGAKGQWKQRYMGHWKESKSGNVIALSLNSYMMHQTPIGTVMSMEFKPSRVGLGPERPWWMGDFAGFWIFICSFVGIVGFLVAFFGWLWCVWSFADLFNDLRK